MTWTIFWISWYVAGVIGTCIIDHFELKHMMRSYKDKSDNTIWISDPATFWQCLLYSLFGYIMFAYGLWILHGEWKYRDQ